MAFRFIVSTVQGHLDTKCFYNDLFDDFLGTSLKLTIQIECFWILGVFSH